MSDNPFTVDLWNSFWEYTHGWALVEKEKSHWDEYWTWVDLFENFWDIQQTEGSI